MAHYGSVCIDIVIDIYAPHELDELAGMSALVRALGINRFADQMDCHRIISHFRCALIPQVHVGCKNYIASEMRVNPEGCVEDANKLRASANALSHKPA
jgi:hypothetical protein